MTEDEKFEAAVERTIKRGIAALNRLLAKPDVSPEVGAAAAYHIGHDCIMADAEGCGNPGEHLLGTIKALIDEAVERGWLPAQPEGTVRVLVLKGHNSEGEVLH